MYLAAKNRGLFSLMKPVYMMRYLKSNKIKLTNIFKDEDASYMDSCYKIDGFQDFIQVIYQHQTLLKTPYFASPIYINPEETDVIYVDFCGL